MPRRLSWLAPAAEVTTERIGKHSCEKQTPGSSAWAAVSRHRSVVSFCCSCAGCWWVQRLTQVSVVTLTAPLQTAMHSGCSIRASIWSYTSLSLSTAPISPFISLSISPFFSPLFSPSFFLPLASLSSPSLPFPHSLPLPFTFSP